MGNSPFPELNTLPLPSPADDPFHLHVDAATNSTTTIVLPCVEEQNALKLLTRIKRTTEALNKLAASVEEGTTELARVRGSIRALAMIGSMMQRRGPLNPDTYHPTVEIFASTTKALLDGFMKAPAFNGAIDIRAIDKPLDVAIKHTKTHLWELLEAPANVAIFKAWIGVVDWKGDWNQPPVQGKISPLRFSISHFYHSVPILREAVEALAKFESETKLHGLTEGIEHAAEAAQGEGGDGTLFELAVNSSGTILQKVGAGTAGMVGQAIGPDGVFLRFLELYALRWLPKGAMAKPDAVKARGFLIRNLMKAIGCTTPAQEESFKMRYGNVARRQQEVAYRKRVLEKGLDKAAGDAKKLEGLLEQAEERLEVAEGDLSHFLSPHESMEKFMAQNTGPWKSAMIALGAIQLFDAWTDFGEVEGTIDHAKLASDIAGLVLQMTDLSADMSVGLLVKAAGGTGNGMTVRVSRGILEHFHLEYEVHALDKIAPIGISVFALVSGVLQIVQGFRDSNAMVAIQGGFQTVSAGMQAYGFRLQASIAAKAATILAESGAEAAEVAEVAMAERVATFLVMGDALGILAFAIGLGAFIYQASKAGTQTVSEGLFDVLTAQKWGYGPAQNFVTALGLEGALKSAAGSMDAVRFFNIPLDASPGNDRAAERDMVIEELKAGGITEDMANRMVEAGDWGKFVNPLAKPVEA